MHIYIYVDIYLNIYLYLYISTYIYIDINSYNNNLSLKKTLENTTKPVWNAHSAKTKPQKQVIAFSISIVQQMQTTTNKINTIILLCFYIFSGSGEDLIVRLENVSYYNKNSKIYMLILNKYIMS